jgi:hypothetical protein
VCAVTVLEPRHLRVNSQIKFKFKGCRLENDTGDLTSHHTPSIVLHMRPRRQLEYHNIKMGATGSVTGIEA